MTCVSQCMLIFSRSKIIQEQDNPSQGLRFILRKLLQNVITEWMCIVFSLQTSMLFISFIPPKKVYCIPSHLRQLSVTTLAPLPDPPVEKCCTRGIPVVVDCSNVFANSLMYMLKRVGLKLHSCLIPWLWGKESFCQS